MRDHPTILKNLLRVENLVDKKVQMTKLGAPLFNWLEISPIDVCNRKCTFCPKSNPQIAPDQHQAIMPPLLFNKIARELEELEYGGTVMLAGYGEPLLSKHIVEMVRAFANVCNTEITTNGDPLTPKKIANLIEAGVSKFVVSLYDGPSQIEEMNSLFRLAGATEEHYILRDRWYDEKSDFGLKLTNRGGTIRFGDTEESNKRPCFYPSYMMMVDWNGDVFLCTQDWNRRVRCGNLNYEHVESVWNSKVFKNYRKSLFSGNRSANPCIGCNADGTKHGGLHATAWESFYGTASNIKVNHL